MLALAESCQTLAISPPESDNDPFLARYCVNDLPAVLDKCKVLMNADDTVIYFTARNAEAIGNTLTNNYNC